MRRFDGKTLLVTGASSGIGRATAKRFAEEGARVVIVDKNAEGLEQTLGSLGAGPHLSRVCDLTDEDATLSLAQSLVDVVGSVHGLVHAAGIHWLRPLQVTDARSLQEMLASHVGSSIAIIRGLVCKRLASKAGCAVALISSAAALKGEAATVAYAAAKGALLSAARALAVELARRKIRVNVVVPGVVRTPQSEAYLSKLPQDQVLAIEQAHLLGLGQPEDIAGALAFLLSDDARWMTGAALVIDGGLTIH